MAAGLGTRFGQRTEKIPKSFIPFKGTPMITRSLNILAACGIERIIIGTGYKRECFEALRGQFPQIECCFNPDYAETNSMYTLYNCRHLIGSEDFILLESDLVFEPRAITALQQSPYSSAMLITPVTKFQDQYFVEMNADHVLTNCSTDASTLHPSGELVGIHKIDSSFYHTMCKDYQKDLHSHLKLGYEYQILHISQHLQPMNVLRIDGLQWYEIDDVDDLTFAEQHIKID